MAVTLPGCRLTLPLLLWLIQLVEIVAGYGAMNTISTLDGAYGNGSDDRTAQPNSYAVCALAAERLTPVCEGSFPVDNDTNAPTSTPLFALSNGRYFSCGLHYYDRTPICWGSKLSSVPSAFVSQRYTEISAGAFHVCALRDDSSGAVDCWGSNNSNQTQPPNSEPLISLTSGSAFTCGLNSARKAVCWGFRISISDPPTQSFDAIFAGFNHMCGILSESKKTLCWGGLNNYKELGAPDNLTFSVMALGRYHSCGLQSDNREAFCWGDNRFDQLRAPQGVLFSLISATEFYTCGVKFDQTIQCWGNSVAHNGYVNGSKVALGFCTSQACGRNQVRLHQCPESNAHVCITPPNDTAPAPAPKKKSPSLLIGGAIGGVVVSGVLLLGACLWCRSRRRRSSGDRKDYFELWEPSTSRISVYTAKELKIAAQGYNDKMVIGKGSFGTVYKGVLANGQVVAIKKAQPDTGKYSSFDNELQLLARLHHLCLVKLLGYCKEQMLVVYEFMENGSLYDCLFKGQQLKLDWGARLSVAAQAARGLEYLHSYASPPIIHRDVKSSNILLDKDWNARVSDFGLSHLGPTLSRTHLSNMTVVGTPGYLDPEYFQTLQLTTKSDVYSFGVVLMELISGRKAVDEKHPIAGIVSWVSVLVDRGAFHEILDAILPPPNQPDLIFQVLDLALQCSSLRGKDRPTMAEVASRLEEIRNSNNRNNSQNSTSESSGFADCSFEVSIEVLDAR